MADVGMIEGKDFTLDERGRRKLTLAGAMKAVDSIESASDFDARRDFFDSDIREAALLLRDEVERLRAEKAGREEVLPVLAENNARLMRINQEMNAQSFKILASTAKDLSDENVGLRKEVAALRKEVAALSVRLAGGGQ